MLLLTSTSDKLRLVTGSAVAVDVHVSWVDNATGTITPGRTNTAITTATTTDIVASPGASTQRNVQTLVIRNKGVSSTNIAIVHTDGTTAVELFDLLLLAQYELQYLDGVGFSLFNDVGQIVSSGATGATGTAGTNGNQGLPGFLQGDPGDDATSQFAGVPTGYVDRTRLGPDAKNWTFLGTISGTGVTVGPLIWTGQFQQIYFEYIIGGYNGGTPVGRILCGSAAITTTGLTNGNGLQEGATANATSVSVPGCPLAVTLSSVPRHGRGWISGASGVLKQIDIKGKSGTVAVATSPTVFSASSYFSDLGTNLLIQRLQLTVYDTLIAAAVSAQTFVATTAIWAWGRNND